MKPSLRKILADSHVAAVAIAVFLLWFLDLGFRSLWEPLFRTASYLFTAVAIFDIPYFTLNGADHFLLIMTFSNLIYALINLTAAWLLSRWVYGVGPLRSLGAYRNKLIRSNHV